ncbi:MAG: PAS domain S-box protein, partial [Candidatus Natronoplasma sp.]
RSFQYPKTTAAKIIFDDEKFKSEGYEESRWKLDSNITVDGETRGSIHVYYKEERPEEDIGPFLKEEKDLIEAVAGILANMIDQRERKKSLEESKKRYKSLIENSIVGVGISDFEDNILFVNRHFANMLGYTKEELVGKNIAELTTEEEYQRLSEKTDERKEGESEVYETKLMRQDGTFIHVTLGATPYFDAEGKMNGTVAFIQDISERKEAEEREQFLHSLLRHDIRNKIQTIDGYHELMKMDSELSDKAEEYLDKAKKGVKNSIELIEKIRTLREAQDEELQEIELESMIDNLVREKESQIGDIELEMNIRCIGDCSVTAGPLLKEVFSNIIENSVKYAEGTKIRISAEKSEDEIICAIEDDGKGIPEDKRGTIFQKGYTTDEERGTGLGLFLVKTLMEIYGGNIKVKDSELGGARFDVHLKKA